MTALVFNCHYNGLSIIQELGRHNIPVFALDDKRSIGTFSRYARFYRCPNPEVAEDSFIEFLLDHKDKFQEKPVLIPTNDHWAMAISRHKKILSNYYYPCVADFETLNLIVNKHKFYEWALSKNYPVPRSWTINEIDSIPEDSFPLAVKPEYRRVSSNDKKNRERSEILDKMRLTVIRNRTDLKQFISSYEILTPWLIFQQYVEGLSDCMYTVGVYADQKYKVRGLFSGRKIRGFPPDIGDWVVGQVERVDDEIKNMVKNICKDIGYHGIAEFEFKQDAITQQFKLIEINPRSWSWIGITPYCDISLPWIAYTELKGFGAPIYKECNLATGSVKYMKLLEDFRNCIYRNRLCGFPNWDMSLRQWCQTLKSKKLVFAEFSKDDPTISLFAVYKFLRTSLSDLLKM